MTDIILMNVTPQEKRIAFLHKNKLHHIYIERTEHPSLVGNIYKAKVSRLAKGIQAAFVDIGFKRSAFLHLKDTIEYAHHSDRSIETFLSPGKEIIVQVYKDPFGSKGPCVTTQLSFPGRYLVFTPGISKISVSQKIKNPAERERLQHLLKQEETHGIIFRTHSEGVTKEEIVLELNRLKNKWEKLKLTLSSAKLSELLYQDLPMYLRTIRDAPISKKIIVDDANEIEKVKELVSSYIPSSTHSIVFYNETLPLFEHYSIENEIEKLLDKRVNLPSGGYVVIDQTEAMVTIDVNTGSYLGISSTRKTTLTTNIEAAHVIAKQLRLRNLGGIILIDFIDMDNKEDQQEVIKLLSHLTSEDYSTVEISSFSKLGLVCLTRKRISESLKEVLCEPCSTCRGRGYNKTIQTICYDILRAIKGAVALYDDWPGFLINASKLAIDCLLTEEASTIKEIELKIEKPIQLQAIDSYLQEQFSVLPLLSIK